MDRGFPHHSCGGKQRENWGTHLRLLLVFLFLGASESFPVSSKASSSVEVLPFAWKHVPSPSPVQTKNSRISVESAKDKDSAKEANEESNSANYSDAQEWLAKQASRSTTPTKTHGSSEAPKKGDAVFVGPDNTVREIYGFSDVRSIQALVDHMKRSHSTTDSTVESPTMDPSSGPAIRSVAAPTPEPLTHEIDTEEPLPVPESEVAPGSETEEPQLTPEIEPVEPYLIPASEVEEPYSIPASEIEEPYSIPANEIEEPYSIPASEVEEPYSIPASEIKEPYSTPETLEGPSSAEAPEADPSMEDMSLPSPSPPSTPITKLRTVALENIKEANKGVRLHVEGPKGKIGVLVPVGVTMVLEDVIIEVPDDVAVVIEAAGGSIAMKNVQLIFKQQSRAMRRALTTAQLSKRKQGLSLTNGSSANITNSKFEGSTDSMVSLEKGSIFHCKGCRFCQNTAQRRGGAILAVRSFVVLENCSFSNNEAQYGGAVWMLGAHQGDEAASLKIRHSLFMYNEVENEGGSLWVKNVDRVEILDSRFSNGIAANKGGALVAESTRELRIVGSNFKKNEAKASNGGAISVAFCSTVEILNSTFESNSAVVGGAVTVHSEPSIEGTVIINNTRFNENKAQNRGGALLLQTKADDQNATSTTMHVSIDQSSFTKNTAANGGAMFVSSESGSNFNFNVEVRSTEFLENCATTDGGGMYCGKQSNINFESSVFQKNEALTGKGCATACGCSIHQKQTESLELQDATGASSTQCDSTVTPTTSGEANSSSNAVTYVMVVLAISVALIVVLVGVLTKNKYRFQFNRRTELLRSLTSIDSSVLSPGHDLSVPFNESREDLPNEVDASEASASQGMGNYTHGEMDCPTPPRSTDLSPTGSVKSPFLSDLEGVEEAEATQTILTEDAFMTDTGEPPLHPTKDAL